MAINIHIKKGRKFLLFGVVFLVIGGSIFWYLADRAFGEQSGYSPTSSTDSRIKQAFDFLVGKGANYGVTDAPDWSNNWGATWNRIMESAAWEPDGTAVEADVVAPKTFYSGLNNRTIKTGTLPAIDYSQQSLVEWDDYKNGGSADDSALEEAVWQLTAGSTTTGVYKDTRTNLYWSVSQGSKTNVFPDTTHTGCPFFTDRITYDGLTGACGDAINACGALSLASDGGAAKTDWYLPSQKELMQAYIDGVYNKTNTTWATTSCFWSSTEDSNNPAYAWAVYLRYGYTFTNTKVTSIAVRCVRRD